jgi:hypothetical protein
MAGKTRSEEDFVCDEHQLLKQHYESALREVELYEGGGAASIRQAIRYEVEARAASVATRDRLFAHSESCPACNTNRA